MIQNKMAGDYAHEKMLQGETMEGARERVTQALAAEGFGILTEIDVSATLKKKIDADFRPYLILGACNPVLAQQALTIEPQIGLFMPCNAVLQQAEGGVLVSIADPHAMFEPIKNPALDPIAEEVKGRVTRALDSLG